MPLNETELLERDAKRSIGEELLAAFGMTNQAATVQSMLLKPTELLPRG